MHCRPRRRPAQVLPAVVHPTKCNVMQNTCEYIVPEIHPSHTTHLTNHVYNHVHSFPHTDSYQQNIANQHFVQRPRPAHYGPGAGAMAPYGGPGGPVAGAMAPYGGPGGPVAGAMAPYGGQQPYGPGAGAMAPYCKKSFWR